MSLERRGRHAAKLRRWVLPLLLAASTPAWASTPPGGLQGLMLWVLAMPGLLVVWLLALILRRAGGFAHAWVRYGFLGLVGLVGLVGLAWLALVLWPLLLGDKVSALVVAIAVGFWGVLATRPAWQPQPPAAAPAPPKALPEPVPAPQAPPAPEAALAQTVVAAIAIQELPPRPKPVPAPPLPPALQGLAAYWIVSSAVPLFLGTRAWLHEEQPLAQLGQWLSVWVLFNGPRLAGAPAQLRQNLGAAQAWLTAAVLLAALGVVRHHVQGAPAGSLAWAVMQLIADLVAWELGRRLQLRQVQPLQVLDRER